jgi:2-dehydro-3-deoxygluconokinase
MADPKRSVCIGEAGIALARGADGRFTLQCEGDTFNTAIYLTRAGQPTAFASALGDDPYSDTINALAQAEGVATDLVLRCPGRLPGLRLISAAAQTAQQGMRIDSWEGLAPARELFELPGWSRLAESIAGARLVYFTGITLSLYTNVGVGRLLAAVELAREKGATIAFDPNFRPRGWKGDLSRTRTVFAEALKRVDIALPAYDDEAVLWGDPSPEATVERLAAFGVNEIVVKNGPNSALVQASGRSQTVPVPDVVVPVDMTAAGDAFNAGFLAARLSGRTPVEAVEAAHKLAANVIRHPGAIVPRTDAVMH